MGFGASARTSTSHWSWRHGTPLSIAIDDSGQLERAKALSIPSNTNAFDTPLEVDASKTYAPRHPSLCTSDQQHHYAVCDMEASGAHGVDGELSKAPSGTNTLVLLIGIDFCDSRSVPTHLPRPFCAQRIFLASVLPPVMEVEKFKSQQAGEARAAQISPSMNGWGRAPPVVS